MTLDGYTLYHITKELSELITGCKIDKVQQPMTDTIIVSLRAPGKNLRLLISASASDSRIHLTEHKYENPKTPPVFCMFLRKHITGAKITNVQQTGLERIVCLSLETKDELGLPRKLELICELMGKYSNIILVDENGIVLESLRHVTERESRVRSVLPSLEYSLPPSTKLNPMTVSETTLIEMLNKRGSKKIKDYLSHLLQGVSSQTAEELLYRYLPGGYELQPKEAEKLAELIKQFFSAEKQPVMYLHQGIPFMYSPVLLSSISGDSNIKFDTTNKLTDQYYGILNELKEINSKRDFLNKKATRQLEKLSSLYHKLSESMDKAAKADEFKTKGDIITANIYRIKRGMESFLAEDYLTGRQIIIEIDKRLSPAANAQMCYKKYAKLKSSVEITEKRMSETAKDIDFLESVQISLDSSENMSELSEIEFELSKADIIPRSKEGAKATEKPTSPHKFISSDGITFYAGKNNRQNDTLTLKNADPEDIWLHTRNIPGSHVIIKCNKHEVPARTLFEAATVAATLSRAKGGTKVSVDYTQKKNVRKPAGAKPGMVIYEGHNTVIVDPDRDIFDKLIVRDCE